MGLDCEYPNRCDCGCQDEPAVTGCKCCGRDDRHASGCLIPENARLLARIAELEAGLAVVKQINAHIRRERDGEYDRAEENAALVNEQRDRAEGLQRSLDDHLESESAETMRAGRALARAEKAEAEQDWIAKSRDTHLERAVEMETQRNALRAERDRYLAAIRQRADAKTIGEMSAADIALRRIAEEKP